jgi:hypothetical protein
MRSESKGAVLSKECIFTVPRITKRIESRTFVREIDESVNLFLAASVCLQSTNTQAHAKLYIFTTGTSPLMHQFGRFEVIQLSHYLVILVFPQSIE